MAQSKQDLRVVTYMCPSHPVQLYELTLELLEETLHCYTSLQYESRSPGPLPDRPDPFTTDKADLAFMTAAAYMKLRAKKLPVELLPVTPVFAHQMNVENKPGYFADIIIHSDKKAHNVNTLLDLRGCAFAYSDEESLSGSKIVLKTLKGKGENASFFGSILKSGSHLSSAQMVLSKQAEWAAVDSTTLLYTKKFMYDGGKDIITLETLGRLPPYPIVANAKLSESGSHLSSAQMVLSKQAEWAAVDSTTLLYTKKFMYDGGKDIITLETLGRLPPYPIVANAKLSAETKQAITNALLNVSQTIPWKSKFAKFGVIKFEINSDVAYDGPAAQMWTIQNEKLNVRYY